jgi:ribosome maturation factor RimP
MTIPEIKQKLQELLTPILERQNAFLVDVAVRPERGTKILQVYLDTDQGVTIDECAGISRDLGRALAQDGSLQGPYNLEVSSPGTDKPLRLLRQFRKNIGRKFKVKYQGPEGTSTTSGKLESIEEERLTFSMDSGEPITLEFARIIEAKEELPW